MKIENIDNQYEGFHAEFYDIMHTDTTDLPFYLEECMKADGPVMEIGSGTGRLLIPLRRNGIDIIGIEPFEETIKIAHQKSKEQTIDCQIIHATAQKFAVAQKFNLAFIGCNTFQHFVQLDDQKSALKNISRHLRKNGKILIDLVLPDIKTMVATDGKTEIFEYLHPSRKTTIKDSFTAKYDFTRQIEEDNIVLEEFDGDTCLRRATADVIMTYFFPRELMLLVENCGFEITNLWKDYNRGAFDANSSLIIIEAKKVS